MNADDVQNFNRWSGSYETSWQQWIFFDPVQNAVIKLVELGSNPASILDVGCGTGLLLRKARGRWPAARLTGIDPAKGMVEKAPS